MRRKGQAYVGLALVGALLLSTVAIVSALGIGPLASIAEDDTEVDRNQGQQNMLDWKDHEVPLKVSSPLASDFEATAFVEQPDESGDYGNYDKYNSTDATSGMTSKIGFYQVTASASDVITFPADLGLPGGENLTLAVTDTATDMEFHPTFTTLDVPSSISEIDYDNGNAQTVVDAAEFRRMADYESDSAEVSTVNDESLGFGDYESSSTDIAADTYDAETGQTLEAERTIELQHGTMALGEVDLDSVSSNVTTVDMTISYTNDEGNTEEIYSETVAEDGELADVDTEIPELGEDEELGANPEWVGKDLTVTYDIEFDGSAVSNDEELFSAGVKDIYGNTVGTTEFVNVLA